MKACKQKQGVRDSYLTMWTNLYISKTMVVLPSNFPWKWCIQKCHHLARNTSTIKAPILSHLMRDHTYIKWNRDRFCYPHFLGSMGVTTFPKPNIFICKIWNIYSIITKFCKVALATTMYTSVHISIQGVMCVNMRSMCMPWKMCMHMWSMFLPKHGFHLVQFMAHWLKVEPKQSTLFFNMQMSLSIFEEDG